jgi:hypothetical protein
MSRLEALKVDITTLAVDAIVNAPRFLVVAASMAPFIVRRDPSCSPNVGR